MADVMKQILLGVAATAAPAFARKGAQPWQGDRAIAEIILPERASHPDIYWECIRVTIREEQHTIRDFFSNAG